MKRSIRSNIFQSLSLAVALFAYSLNLSAQYGTGTILGSVTDPSGAPISGLKVTVKNLDTNETRDFMTDSAGDYRFTALPVGQYSISAAAASFKTATVESAALQVNTQLRVDIIMQLGSVAEKIQVTAQTPQLQTDTATLGTSIDKRTMLELPLNSRNFYDLMALSPAVIRVFGASAVMDNRTASLGGSRSTSVGANLDGVDFTIGNVSNPAIALSLDAIEEFKVQLNFVDASYGHGVANIDMIIRRGTNAFHGVVYDFVRNRAFQAGQFFRPPRGAPRFSYNQFGVSAGGAIVKNKTFYFGNYEGRRRRTGTIQQSLVPTSEMQQGDFSALGRVIRDPSSNNEPFPGNIISSTRFDGISKQLIQYFPAPNFVNIRPGVNYLITPSDTEQRDQFTIRIDQRISDKGMLFGHYSFAQNEVVGSSYRPPNNTISPNRHQHVAIGYTHVVNPGLVSETRLGFTRAFLAASIFGDRTSTNYAKELGLKNLAANPGDYSLPALNLVGYSSGNVGNFGGRGSRIVQNNLYYRAGEALTYIRNRHALKFGGDISRLMMGYDQGSNQDGIFAFSGNYTGNAFSDFLLGLPGTALGGLGSVGNLGGVAKYSIGTQFQWYVQDDWKVTERLTLNLGVRYELFQQWRGRLANFDLGTGRQLLAGSASYYVPGVGLIQGSGTPLLPERPIVTDPNNFGPRLGIAYRIGSRTTLRTGAGVFYDLTVGTYTLATMMSTPPYFINATLVSDPTRPQYVLSQLFPSPDQVRAAVTTNIDLQRRTPYVYQYNFNLQHQVRPGLLVEAGYMGNTGQKGSGLNSQLWVNQPRLPSNPVNPEPFAQRMPYPSLPPTFQQVAHYQWNNYNAGYLKVEQRVAGGLSFTVAYTFSKLLDSGAAGQNMNNRRLERGLSDLNVTNNFNAGYVYELPFGRGRHFNIRNRYLDVIAGGWQISGITTFQTGVPITIVTASDIGLVGTGGQRASATGVAPQKLDPRTNNLLGFNVSAYTLPARGTFGNLARNVQPGFGTNNWDVGFDKSIAVPRLGEASRFQIRAEFFNIVNHTQFSGIGTAADIPSNFGRVNSARDPRIMQLAGRLYW